MPGARPFFARVALGWDIAIPTTSIEQYGATLAKWFGVPPAALTQVFPNLPAFASTDLGFLS